jgi:hypothetical protein
MGTKKSRQSAQATEVLAIASHLRWSRTIPRTPRIAAPGTLRSIKHPARALKALPQPGCSTIIAARVANAVQISAVLIFPKVILKGAPSG